MSDYAVIGFGCAGYSAAKALREACPEARIDVYSDTDEAPSNPMLTTYYVAGKIQRQEMFPMGKKEEVVERLGVRLYENAPVARLRAAERTVVLRDGTECRYDGVILATGSHPLVPKLPEMPEKNVYVMRTVRDADALLSAIAGGARSALVVGASWVGIKVVEALLAHGVSTVMADLAPRIFPTATLPETAKIIHRRLEAMGVSLLFGRGVSALREVPGGLETSFSDGSAVKSDIVVLCLGARPTVDFLDPGEIELGTGIRVDRHQRTSVPYIYAAGDCCEAREMINGRYVVVNLWANAAQQGRVAGRSLAGLDDSFQGNFLHNVTHFLDMDFIGLGDNRAEGEKLLYVSPEGWRFEAVLREDRLACVNILDNNSLSGPVKAALLKRCASCGPLSLEALLALGDAGLPENIITKIKGESHDDA